MGIYSKTFGKEGQVRRTVKREERRLAFEKSREYRPTLEERLAWGDLQPHTDAAERSGLGIYSKSAAIAQHPAEMQKAAEEKSSFLRVARMVPPLGFRSGLLDAIELGTREHQAISQYCGATLMRYNFCLFDARNGYIRHLGGPLIPNGYVLAAQVESVKNTKPLSPEQEAQITSGIQEYYDEANTNYSSRLKDIHPKQFVNGMTKTDSAPQLYLVDIDMIFG